jgi:hypothetical protein
VAVYVGIEVVEPEHDIRQLTVPIRHLQGSDDSAVGDELEAGPAGIAQGVFFNGFASGKKAEGLWGHG